MMTAQAILKRVADDLDAKPRLREEARAALTLFSYLGLRNEEELILFLLGQCAGLQDRIDELERRLG
jgi:hypothetical protein